MSKHRLWQAGRIAAIILLAGSVGVAAQAPRHVSLSGEFHDHTAVSAGAWEIHGEWALTVSRNSGQASFAAALAMERSDLWAFTAPNPDARSPHTHHIFLTSSTVTTIPNGFRVTGVPVVTSNGNTSPFGTASTVQIDVTGGTIVTYSNIQMTFGGDAAGHFGTSPVHGVVVE